MQKLLTISCSEIYVVRIICKRCNASMDLPLERFDHGGVTCPGCSVELRRAGVDTSFRELSNAIRHLQREKEMKVQFVVPADS